MRSTVAVTSNLRRLKSTIR